MSTPQAQNALERAAASADLNALANLADDEIIDYDTEADLSDRVVVPEGEYDARFRLGSRGVTGPKADKNGKAYFTAEVEVELIAPDTPWDGYKLSEYLTTILFPGAGTSILADFLNKVGAPLRRGMKLSEVPEHTVQALAGEPTGKVFIQWRGQVKDEDTGYWNDFKGMRGARHFPEKEDGTRETSVEGPNGERIVAIAKVARFASAQ